LSSTACKGPGFVVDSVGSADEGEAALRMVDYDVLVLDLGLPDYDGMVLLRNLRASGVSIPVLVLTARDHVSDRVKGLNLGADDYLVKPFALEEVVARLRALLRRPSDTLSSMMTVGNMRFDVLTRELVVDGAAAALSRRESDKVTVSRLRRNLKRLGATVTVRTFRGVGYLLEGTE
jgi:DNA-binding response OmpR family regulator